MTAGPPAGCPVAQAAAARVRPALLRSVGGRVALLFAAVFAGSALALAWFLWWATAGALERQTDAAVRADTLGLEERWREGGVAKVTEAIAGRLALDEDGVAFYRLEDGLGRRLAGNLSHWPSGPAAEDDWFRVAVPHGRGRESEARLHRVDLGDDGHRLLVGRDVDERLRLEDLLSEGLLWTAGALAVLALLGALLVRRALEGRLQPAFATAVSIAAGDLTSRVPVSGRGDEFDRLAATTNAMLDRIARLMAGLRDVSDAIAHDLRTPIARARGRLEEALAAAGPAATPQGEALRGAVERGIADLDAITRVFQALLRIAEAEAGARRAAFAPLDLVPVLADAAEFYAAAAEARDQRLETALPDRLPLVGDRDLLLQAVANLLDNAVKFAPPGGAIRLSARRLPPPDPAGDGHGDGSAQAAWIEVAVADDGPGLPPEDRARAGERFFRADAARATPGSGLGLSLVHAVAQLHGGGLRLEDADPAARPPGLRAALRLRGG